IYLCFFFFSSRRRHTRSKRDWSSDVCSSDLMTLALVGSTNQNQRDRFLINQNTVEIQLVDDSHLLTGLLCQCSQVRTFCTVNVRSEERRVGKERRHRGTPSAYKQNTLTNNRL